MCPPVFVTMALWQLMYSCTNSCMSCHKAIVEIIGRAHCFHDSIYMHIYIYICIYNIYSIYICIYNIYSIYIYIYITT